jgi:uncharacterized protein (DUF362 family)
MNRREFMIVTAGGIMTFAAGEVGMAAITMASERARKAGRTRIALIKTDHRESGIGRALELLQINPLKGKDVLLKPNFNTAAPFPASTHNDTLSHLILKMKEMGARDITIGERSGPPHTEGVIREKGIGALAKRLGVKLINFEELPPGQWARIRPKKSHWRDGFDVARPLLNSACVVSTCCLKTHAFGGVFTMSLKNSVGFTHKRNMRELHGPHSNLRKMIAEINQVYRPSLILMDGMEAFVDGGPARGERKRANVMVAGTDRIAIDAVGLSILKELGSNRAVMGKKIFEQEQIARAVELGLGVSRPEDIEIVSDDKEGGEYAARLMKILLKG